MIRMLFCFWLLFFSTGILRAQVKLEQVVDPIAAKMEWYGAKKKTANLFVHFDKNIYTSNEHVWFTAYLLSAKTGAASNHTLAVALIKNEDSSIRVNHKFIMENGLGFGHFILPDSLSPGSYSLVAFTNALWNGKPVVSFVQPITIKTPVQSGFTATLKLAEKIIPGADSAKISFKAFAKDIRTLASATEVSYTLNKKHDKFKTDLFGAAVFNVPIKELTLSNNRLRLKASFRNETKQLQLMLPVGNDEPVVKFFPEGGSITGGAKNVVGWEARDAYGQPIAISGILFRNNESIDTIQTNGYGMGRFSIAANPGEQYHVKLFRSGVLTGDYALPVVSSRPISIAVAKAVCSDTLVFYTEAPSRGTYYAIIHDYTVSYFSFVVDMNASPLRRFRLPLHTIPKGVHTLTIIDAEGRPLAERLFFAHYDQKAEADIVTDKKEYQTREAVKLSIKLKDDPLVDSVTGYVSIACVQENRIDARKMTDIESYTFLNRELNNISFKKRPMQFTEENLQYWEDILLIKGWRRYTWSDMMAATVSDTTQRFSEIAFSGNIISRRKQGKPLDIVIASDKSINTVTTDNEGRFLITREPLVTDPGKKIILTVNGESQRDYTVNIEDPYRPYIQELSTGLTYNDPDFFLPEGNSETLVLKKGESAEMLAEVTVTASKKDDSFAASYKSVNVLGRNDCGDYVCGYGILNCSNHTLGLMPVKGRTYKLPYGGVTVYAGCTVPELEDVKSYMKVIDGIYTAKEFYKTDYAQLAPSETAFLSTIFWDYAMPVSSVRTAELSFPTSDITGNFRVVIQGITTKGVIHAEHVFSVIKSN